MIFHSGFTEKHSDICNAPNWFELRADLYEKVSHWENRPVDEIYFDFSAPNCGWMNVFVYINGKKRHTFPLTAAHNPLTELRTWMEDIVNDFKLASDLYLELEGRTAILHYEHICLADIGMRRKFVHKEWEKDEWASFDANDGAPDAGLFYMYDSATPSLPIVCYCLTKQFLFALYNGLLHYSSKGASSLIGKEWYYLDHDDNGNPINDNWTFYNDVKSPLIEWNYDSRKAYRHCCPTFIQQPKIVETVHMWAEYGIGLFWGKSGVCYGTSYGLTIDTDDISVDLDDMTDLREWYNEFDEIAPEDRWPEEQYKSWFKRGWEIAKQVRKRLPQNVDLFYQWKSFAIEELETVNIPIIVPDERLLMQQK